MIWILLAGIVLLAAAVWCGYQLADVYASGLYIIGAFTFGVAGIFGLLIPTITWASRSVGRTTCRNWEEQTGYQTKFQVLNLFDGGTCLAKTRGGHWVQNTHVIINVPEKP